MSTTISAVPGIRTRGLPRSSGRVSLRGAGLGLGGLDLAVLRRRVGLERLEQVHGGVRDLVDGALEGLLVDLGGLREAADLADVLERGGADLFPGRFRLEVVEGADVAAHTVSVAASSPCGRAASRRPWTAVHTPS